MVAPLSSLCHLLFASEDVNVQRDYMNITGSHGYSGEPVLESMLHYTSSRASLSHNAAGLQFKETIMRTGP